METLLQIFRPAATRKTTDLRETVAMMEPERNTNGASHNLNGRKRKAAKTSQDELHPPANGTYVSSTSSSSSPSPKRCSHELENGGRCSPVTIPLEKPTAIENDSPDASSNDISNTSLLKQSTEPKSQEVPVTGQATAALDPDVFGSGPVEETLEEDVCPPIGLENKKGNEKDLEDYERLKDNQDSQNGRKDHNGGKKRGRPKKKRVNTVVEDRTSKVQFLLTGPHLQSIPDDGLSWHVPRQYENNKGASNTNRPFSDELLQTIELPPPLSPPREDILVPENIPDERSIQFSVRKRMEKCNPILCPSNKKNELSPQYSSLAVFYRWLRVRFASGLVRPSLQIIHGMLSKDYEEARLLLDKISKRDCEGNDKMLQRLMRLRNRLAGTWCIYAHVILELGHQALLEEQQRQNNENDSFPSERAMFSATINLIDDDATETSDFELRRCSLQPKKKKKKVSNKTITFKATPPEQKRPRGRPRKNSLTPPKNPPPPTPKTLSPSTLNSPNQRKRKPRQSLERSIQREQQQPGSVPFKDVLAHAVSVLNAARKCPLVQNHPSIVLSLGRIMITGVALEVSTKSYIEELSTEKVYNSITQAISTCWDAMDICHNKKLAKRFCWNSENGNALSSIRFVAHFDYSKQRPLLKGTRVSKEETASTMESILDLPEAMRNSWGFNSAVFEDRNAIRALCVELNRLSRLGERIQLHRHVRLESSSSSSKGSAFEDSALLDELPLFSAFDYLNDTNTTQRANSKCENIEFIPPPALRPASTETSDMGVGFLGNETVVWIW